VSCRTCVRLREHSLHFIGAGRRVYRCTQQRFELFADRGRARQYYAWSGIVRPNSAVARAQANCPYYEFRQAAQPLPGEG